MIEKQESDEQWLEHGSVDIVERDDLERAGVGKQSTIGIIQVGALISSASKAKSSSSSVRSYSQSCWASVLDLELLGGSWLKGV